MPQESKPKTDTLSCSEKEICLKQCALVGGILAIGLGSTGVFPGRVVSGKELLWLLNSNDRKRNEGKIVVLTSDLLVLFAGG